MLHALADDFKWKKQGQASENEEYFYAIRRFYLIG